MARIRTIKPYDLDKIPTIDEVWAHGSGLYLIQEAGGPLKVGICTHPRRRISTLQCGNPRQIAFVGLFLGERKECRYVERATLQEFRAHVVRGEWLQATPDEVLEFWEQFVVAS